MNLSELWYFNLLSPPVVISPRLTHLYVPLAPGYVATLYRARIGLEVASGKTWRDTGGSAGEVREGFGTVTRVSPSPSEGQSL
jgi:hypothetical protein